jgi:GNAT superfamily N-acetyltransferase
MSHALEIQPIHDPQGVTRLAKLAHAIWNEYFPPLIGQAQVDYMVERFQSAPAITRQITEGYEYYLLVNEGQAAGYVCIKPEHDRRLFLSKLYVQDRYRGRGLARRALAFIENRARESACTAVHLTCNRGNHAAIAAYERLGFVHTGTVVMDIGHGFVMDDVTMEKPVSPGP